VAPEENNAGVNASSYRLSVLLVDQATPVRERIKAILEELIDGCDVREAGSVAEAQQLFRSSDPDLVMLDLDLPDGNGLKFLSFVKQYRRECKVVVLSSYDDLEIRQFCFGLGADHFFVKSTEFEQAVETINGIAHWSERPQRALHHAL
jgi:two-component system, NarL family, response regulator DevR